MAKRTLTVAAILLLVSIGSGTLSRSCLAWGDEGHKIIALISERFLNPVARSKVSALLAADPDDLTTHDIASEATWADRYRDSDRLGAKVRYEATRRWHFVDIELRAPNVDEACFGHPQLPAGKPAAIGPSEDCVVDKIDQFAAELANPSTNPEERIVALKFLLHFVGDVHQPLHASDDHDKGGNTKRVTAEGFRAGNLHHFWDTEFVKQLGSDPKAVASDLVVQITDDERNSWSRGNPAAWAQESFAVARDDAYGRLPFPTSDSYRLGYDYIEMAVRDVSTQLSRAGVRLAFVLNKALGDAP